MSARKHAATLLTPWRRISVVSDCVASDTLVQRLASNAVSMHRSDLISNVVVHNIVDSATVNASECGARRPTASRSHFK